MSSRTVALSGDLDARPQAVGVGEVRLHLVGVVE
jgi:hypothetical protein